MSCLSVSLSTTYILEKHDTHFFYEPWRYKRCKKSFFLPIVIRTTTHSLGVPRNIISIGIDPPFLQNIPRMTQMYCFYHPHIYHHCHPHHLGHVSSANQTYNMFQRLHSIFVLVNFRICMHELMIQK